ncbi:SUMF1/EgtB/PvdO family nonheme iron enzyme [Rufibacter quisquiliarum]|uniref:Gliding motility-associated lipoprotein GldK n=1 Tax=Rufibacter quisquiliarum TaxID=1549639 RepID=A0A839GQR5_9BACT|nr:SUMF1/EgtB/PvdO family nonheme iron enzyme [Rufibacter quisquiliarum]MBA9076181.1 gliding motility-associated lipoprotein GldK [Rufibacter quisquiliarum]
MNKFLQSSAIALSVVLMAGCGMGRSSEGDVIGAADRPEFNPQEVPYGMIACPGGTFHMGQTDQDIAASMSNLNKQVTIGGFYMDETEITNNEYRQFIDAIRQDSLDVLGEEYVMTQLYPDTTVWVRDFTYHMGDPLMEYYFTHPAFDDYPVVGVDWFAAKYFNNWRTKLKNAYNTDNGQAPMPNFRLPSEAEWEYAARGGRDLATYPWGGPYLRNARGCMLANFKPGRGDYYSDGFTYTAPVGQYYPNDFGLYDMSGNVAEWCEDAYSEASVPVVWDLNPTYYKDDEPRKIVRGGSWKDIAYFLETGVRNFEYQDSARSYIGFRSAMIYIGRSSGREFGFGN